MKLSDDGPHSAKFRSHCLFTSHCLLEDASIALLVECKVCGKGMSEQIQFAMQNWSIEFTPSNKTKIDDFRRVLPIGTTVNVTAIPGADPALMTATVEQLATQEMNPVPILRLEVSHRSVCSRTCLPLTERSMSPKFY